jgi:hypothetical protein
MNTPHTNGLQMQGPPVKGNMGRFGDTIYLETALANKDHVDVPGHDDHTTFNRSLFRFNAFAGSVVSHEGLPEMYDAEALKRQVALDKYNNAYAGKPIHDPVLSLLPGFVPDFRPPQHQATADFGGLDDTEVADAESKLRLYRTYSAMPGVGTYGSAYQNIFF